MSRSTADRTWERLSTPAERQPEPFDPATLDSLPPAARRWLRRAIPEGCPLTDCVELDMDGDIKLGPRWLPFTARQVLRAGTGFVWRPVVGGRLLRFVGADLLGPDGGRMEFRLHGIIPVVTATGSDVDRSAAGRLAAETVAWLPQACTPQSGARWSTRDGNDGETHVVVTLTVPRTAAGPTPGTTADTTTGTTAGTSTGGPVDAEVDTAGIDLAEADPTEIDTAEIDAAEAGTTRIDMAGTDMAEADVREIDTAGVDRARIDMTGTDMAEADMAEIDVEVFVDDAGRLTEIGLQRWNDTTKPPSLRPFGGHMAGEHITAEGVRVAATGEIGWGWRTADEATDRFFRYRLTRVAHTA